MKSPCEDSKDLADSADNSRLTETPGGEGAPLGRNEAHASAGPPESDRARALAGASEEGILVHDGHLVHDCTESFARMFGHASCGAVIGRSVTDFVAPEALQAVRQRVRMRHEAPYESLGRRADGSSFPVEFIAKEIEYLGRRMRAVVVRDLSQRKSSERALRAEAVRSKREAQRSDLMAREMSHRMLNSLSAVQALLALQSRQVSDPVARETVAGIAERVRAMAFVQQRLFEAARVDRRRVDASAYLGELAGDLRRAFFGEAQTLEVESEGGIRLPTECASAIGMIVTELVINAAKHAFPGGGPGRVCLRLERLDDGCRLTLADDGVGLPAEPGPAGRSGSGMRIVRGLTEQLRGTLQVERGEPGTRFRITFPC